MWNSVVVLALLAALDPMRLGITLLVISRPRPVKNLLTYGVGNLTACIPTLVVPLAVLNFTPMFRSFTRHLASPATSSTVGHIQIGMGVLTLSIAALMTVRFSARQRAHLSTPGGNTSTQVPDSNTATAISPPLGRAQDAGTEGGSANRRLVGRVQSAWENGSLWVAWWIGFGSGPPLDGVIFLLAITVASGATVGTQVSAAIALIAGMLAVVEITLVSYLVTPAKTQAVMRLLHDWALAHRRKILVAIFVVIGVSLVVRGVCSI
jgi:hypothetical protein